LCAVLFFSFCALAQHKQKTRFYDREKTKLQVVYYVLGNNQNVIDSLYEEYFYNGQLRSRGNYKMNKPVGLWEYFYENGALRMKGEIQEFQNHGFWTYYYENGGKNMEGNLEKGQKNGDWTQYYENGKLKSKGTYVQNKATGPWYYFYEDGATKAFTFYEKGKGFYREYYKSGGVKMEGLLVNGKSDSVWNYYHENGKLKATGVERGGLKDGFWKFMHETGLLASEGLYLNGVPFGNWRYFHENGALSMEGTHKDGEKDGFWKLYYPTGEFKAESQFKLGEGPYKEYYESGKMKVTGYIKKGVNEGSWVYYHEDGSIEGYCQFVNGEGKFTGYYPNGIKKMEGVIQNGVKTGVWKLYKPKGELAGFYRTYYEDKQTVFVPLQEVEDTLKTEVLADTLKNKKMEDDSKNTSTKRRRLSKIRYFRPRITEYKALLLSTNPLAMFVYRQIPFCAEYIIEERLGIQFIYTFHKSPFFSSSNSLPPLYIAKEGHSFELMQKFYHPNTGLGSLYFGHSFRYKVMNFSTTANDTLAGSEKVFNYKLGQKAFEYAIVGGNRIFISGRDDRRGWTLDFFVGLAIGKLNNRYNTGSGYFPYSLIFEDVPQNEVYFTGKLGFTFGYMF
jgi:antitoxin component YwqK of YwqJK toxin-antitoxin module